MPLASSNRYTPSCRRIRYSTSNRVLVETARFQASSGAGKIIGVQRRGPTRALHLLVCLSGELAKRGNILNHLPARVRHPGELAGHIDERAGSRRSLRRRASCARLRSVTSSYTATISPQGSL